MDVMHSTPRPAAAAFILCLALVVLSACQGVPTLTTTPPGFRVETYLDGVTYPVSMAFAPDGRLFYTERHTGIEPPLTGGIRVVAADGTLQARPFATVDLPDDTPHRDKGLLGITLDPGFSTNGYLYAFRTALPDGSNPNEHGEVVRYTSVLSGTDWIGTDPTPIVDDLPASADCCHNGGEIAFGPDGTLYVTVGDTEDWTQGQNLQTRAATILRYNPDGTIPADNPYVSNPAVDPAIYAYGLRNVFGLDWHPETGELYATDNGPNCNDELNHIVAGGNYGWADSFRGEVRGALHPPYIEPVFVWEQPIGPTAVEFYTGDTLPGFQGDLFLSTWDGRSDHYGNGTLFRVTLAEDGSRASVVSLFENCNRDQAEGMMNMLDVETGSDGNLYFSCQEALFPAPAHTGAIYRLVPDSPAATPQR